MKIRKSTVVTGLATGVGTANTIAKYTSASAIGNSSITDDGTSVTLTEPLILTPTTATPSAAAVWMRGHTGGGLEFNIATGQSFSMDVNNAGIFTIGPSGRIAEIFGIATTGTGPGVSAVFAGPPASTGLTGASINFIDYTPPAAAGRYRISWAIDTTTATTDSFTVVVTWKNATGTARSQNSGGFDKNGSALVAGAITSAIGAGAYYGSMMIDIDNSATAITLSTAGTFTTVVYNLGATLEQLV